MMGSRTIIGIGIAVVVAAILFLCGYKVGKSHAPEIWTTDTVTVIKIDTVVMEKLVPYAVHVRDTVTVHTVDTLYQDVTVQLPFEEKEYRDSLFRAIVSGFRPSLDYMEVYPKTVYQTVNTYVEVPKKYHWGLGVTAGYGATIVGGRVQAAPYVGVGVSWNLLCW